MLRSLHRIGQKGSLLLSLIAVAGVAVFEIIAGIASNSMAVLSDGIHASFDAMLTSILLIMLMLSMKPRDMEHTYGHGRLETIAGLIGGIVLFIAAIFIVRESLSRILEAELVMPSILGIYAVTVALCVAVFRAVILAYNMHGMSVRAGFYDAVADMGSSMLALLGLILAGNGLYAADGMASIALAGMIIFMTSRLVYSSAMELSDAIDPSLVSTARRAVLSVDGVRDCRDVRMRKVGRDILADVTVALAAGITFSKAHEISSKVEDAVMKATSATMVMVHFEPQQEQPVEHLIAEVAAGVDGVKDVHNILVSRDAHSHSIIVSMHVQVDRSLRLDEAHGIADMVEHAVRSRIRDVKDVTVHVEPILPDMSVLEELDDRGLETRIRGIAFEQGIRHISRIDAYTCNGILRVDMHCSMDADTSIEEAHDIISRVERIIRDEFNAVVTIHVEPYNLSLKEHDG